MQTLDTAQHLERMFPEVNFTLHGQQTLHISDKLNKNSFTSINLIDKTLSEVENLVFKFIVGVDV